MSSCPRRGTPAVSLPACLTWPCCRSCRCISIGGTAFSPSSTTPGRRRPGAGEAPVFAPACWMCCICVRHLAGLLGPLPRLAPGGLSSNAGTSDSTGVLGTALRGRSWLTCKGSWLTDADITWCFDIKLCARQAVQAHPFEPLNATSGGQARIWFGPAWQGDAPVKQLL